jgi:hypothetical protein
VTADSGLTVQTVLNSFRILKEQALNLDQEFDKATRLESRLETLSKKVFNTNQNFNTFKGQFYEIHENVIGRDISLFKLERVQKTNEKSKPLVAKV